MDTAIALMQLGISAASLPLFFTAALANAVGLGSSSTKKLIPKTILITGATSGIGEALALRYAKPGVTLALTGRNASNLDRVAKLCRDKGANVATKQVDVQEKEEIGAWIRSVDAQTPLDLVVANAGVSEQSAGLDIRDVEACARNIYGANVIGVFNTIFPAIEGMRKRKSGQVAIMSSMSSFLPMSGAPSYSSSKWSVRLYGTSLRAQLYREGVRVSVIAPGYVRSPMTDANRFSMEYMVEMDYAIDRIINGLERDTALIAFPWQMVVMSYLMVIIPPTLFDFFARNRLFNWIAYWKPSTVKAIAGGKV